MKINQSSWTSLNLTHRNYCRPFLFLLVDFLDYWTFWAFPIIWDVLMTHGASFWWKAFTMFDPIFINQAINFLERFMDGNCSSIKANAHWWKCIRRQTNSTLEVPPRIWWGMWESCMGAHDWGSLGLLVLIFRGYHRGQTRAQMMMIPPRPSGQLIPCFLGDPLYFGAGERGAVWNIREERRVRRPLRPKGQNKTMFSRTSTLVMSRQWRSWVLRGLL